jgi:glycosyltransferase involved in cell wall biosynthesis
LAGLVKGYWQKILGGNITKLLIHSNAPWAPTGYGQQVALFAPLLAEHYDVAISAFYGLEGAPLTWNEIPVFPGLGGEFGNETLIEHAERFFGDAHDGLVMTLCDVWPLEPSLGERLNLVCWCPVDHRPAPPKVFEFLAKSGAVPIAMSRFGQRMLALLDPLYCPHAVDGTSYTPGDRRRARRGLLPDNAFLIGMVAANKGHPSRKAFPQALEAAGRVMSRHDDVYLYLHTVLDAEHGRGVNIPALVEMLGIDEARVRKADQYALKYGPYQPAQMASIYRALDVLLSPSFGEGFGIPVLEAQSCGVPAIVTDYTAMSEVCDAGWKVSHTPYFTGLSSWQAIPDIDAIERALEDCYALNAAARASLADRARRHAETYDVRRVLADFMLPSLRIAEQRFAEREPVTIPSRLAVAA